jgi:hypothetical protein
MKLFKLKYKFDLGTSFLSIINFILLVIAVSGQIAPIIGISNKIFVLIFTPIAIIGMFLFGHFMDKMKAAQHYEKEAIKRSDVWREHIEQTKRIEYKLDKMK